MNTRSVHTVERLLLLLTALLISLTLWQLLH
jgi:hypothetical protein